jgi:5-oxoprolinase (ATP-hydrolysing) subunit C
MIEILTSGLSNSVQDLGRTGYLDSGVSRSGAMDRTALEIGNSMLGNAPDAAGLEIAYFPFRLKFHRSVAFAVTGADGQIRLNDTVLPSWWAVTAKAGDVLVLEPPQKGARVVVAFAGGLDIPKVMRSRATDLKSAYGGFSGRGLMRGDRLAVLPLAPHIGLPSGAGFGVDASNIATRADNGPIVLRVMPAAEQDCFTDTSLADFYETEWTLSPEANRQGFRLDGPKLLLQRPVELFSHGIMTGTIQVPPSGQPVIQMAEANTCGGYPKIGCIITADLSLLAQAKVGANLRFAAVTREAALEALRHQRSCIEDIGLMAALVRKDTGKGSNG